MKTAAALLCLALATPAVIAADAYGPKDRENIEWCDIWIAHATESALPRVLLIGDSITRAYGGEVDKRLAGKVYVARLASSAFVSDPVLLEQITMVLDHNHFDVIHFNNGMHGWTHLEEEYRAAFPVFLDTIRKHAPGAKLIWANTTPLKVSPTGGTGATDDRIAARNVIAAEAIKPYGIPVDDLFTPMKGHPELHSDNVHFNGKGVALQAAQVADVIEKLLSSAK